MEIEEITYHIQKDPSEWSTLPNTLMNIQKDPPRPQLPSPAAPPASAPSPSPPSASGPSSSTLAPCATPLPLPPSYTPAQPSSPASPKPPHASDVLVASLIATITFVAPFTFQHNDTPLLLQNDLFQSLIYQAVALTFCLWNLWYLSRWGSIPLFSSMSATMVAFAAAVSVLGTTFQIFMVYDAAAFAFSLGSLLFYSGKNCGQHSYRLGSKFLFLSMSAMMMAFATGVYVLVAPKCLWLAVTVYIIIFSCYLLHFIYMGPIRNYQYLMPDPLFLNFAKEHSPPLSPSSSVPTLFPSKPHTCTVQATPTCTPGPSSSPTPAPGPPHPPPPPPPPPPHTPLSSQLPHWSHASDSDSLVASFIATITFAAALTVPGGFNQDNGTPILMLNAAFQTFLLSDTFALAFSLSYLLTMSSFGREFLYSGTNFDQQSSRWGSICLFLSVIATMVAFATAVYVVVAPKCLWLAVTVCIIMFSCFLLHFIFLIRYLWLILRNKTRGFYNGFYSLWLISRDMTKGFRYLWLILEDKAKECWISSTEMIRARP